MLYKYYLKIYDFSFKTQSFLYFTRLIRNYESSLFKKIWQQYICL